MSSHAYLRYHGDQSLPDLPVPVREERLATVMHDGKMQPDALLDELDHFLTGHPEYRHNYAELAARLAYITGMQMTQMGLWDAAAHYLKIGARWCPQSCSATLNHALALQLAGDHERALAGYLHALADPALGSAPLATVLAARCCWTLGRWKMGSALLESLVPLAPREPSFWEFLAEMKEKAAHCPEGRPGAIGHPSPDQPSRRAKFCVKCGAPGVEGDHYCRRCGAAL